MILRISYLKNRLNKSSNKSMKSFIKSLHLSEKTCLHSLSTATLKVQTMVITISSAYASGSMICVIVSLTIVYMPCRKRTALSRLIVISRYLRKCLHSQISTEETPSNIFSVSSWSLQKTKAYSLKRSLPVSNPTLQLMMPCKSCLTSTISSLSQHLTQLNSQFPIQSNFQQPAR